MNRTYTLDFTIKLAQSLFLVAPHPHHQNFSGQVDRSPSQDELARMRQREEYHIMASC